MVVYQFEFFVDKMMNQCCSHPMHSRLKLLVCIGCSESLGNWGRGVVVPGHNAGNVSLGISN